MKLKKINFFILILFLTFFFAACSDYLANNQIELQVTQQEGSKESSLSQ